MTFRLFDAEAQGNLLWEATYSVVVSGGAFAVELGSGSPTTIPASLFGSPNLWLSVAVKNQAISGRQRLLASGYAIRAESARAAEVAAAGSPLALQGVPVGTIVAFFGVDAPDGWLIADGATIDSSTSPQYAALVAHLRALSFTGPTATTAILPDLQGRFLRGLDKTRKVNVDPAAVVGTQQSDSLQHHRHVEAAGHTHGTDPALTSGGCSGLTTCAFSTVWVVATTTSSQPFSRGTYSTAVSLGDAVQLTGSPVPRVADETRPVNTTILWILKY
jgi:microcystin-dependent protein